jgi:hypothetical protein
VNKLAAAHSLVEAQKGEGENVIARLREAIWRGRVQSLPHQIATLGDSLAMTDMEFAGHSFTSSEGEISNQLIALRDCL